MMTPMPSNHPNTPSPDQLGQERLADPHE
jgi:hypothetical protein